MRARNSRVDRDWLLCAKRPAHREDEQAADDRVQDESHPSG
jgi:hypothetical protein